MKKVLDPSLLAKLNATTKTQPQPETKIVEKIVEVPVEKIVEKIVEKEVIKEVPVEKIVYRDAPTPKRKVSTLKKIDDYL